MIACTFALNGSRTSLLRTPFGAFSAFSGDGPNRNNPSSGAIPDGGATPPGRYYIVERPSGGRLGPIRDWALGRDEWFALYRSDGVIDDRTFIDGVERGQFRLHPLGPRRMSTGCVVLQNGSDFTRLREKLLATTSKKVAGSLVAYGTLDIVYLSDQLDPRYHQGNGTAVV